MLLCCFFPTHFLCLLLILLFKLVNLTSVLQYSITTSQNGNTSSPASFLLSIHLVAEVEDEQSNRNVRKNKLDKSISYLIEQQVKHDEFQTNPYICKQVVDQYYTLLHDRLKVPKRMRVQYMLKLKNIRKLSMVLNKRNVSKKQFTGAERCGFCLLALTIQSIIFFDSSSTLYSISFLLTLSSHFVFSLFTSVYLIVRIISTAIKEYLITIGLWVHMEILFIIVLYLISRKRKKCLALVYCVLSILN